MKPQNIRHLIIALLMTTGVFHLAVALLDAGSGLGWPLTAFGLVYIGLSFYVRRDVQQGLTKRQKKKAVSRAPIIVTMAVTAVALAIGGARYIMEGGPMALPLMFFIDGAIIAAGAWWLMKVRAKA